MIKGLIIYQKDDALKNQWFIDKCLKELNDSIFSLLYKEEQEVLSYIDSHPVDFVINRTRNHLLLKELEKRQIRSFNSSKTNRIANDKYETFKLAKQYGFPCVKTSLKSEDFVTPYVAKSVSGHGGQEVYLIQSKEDLSSFTKNTSKKYIYQEYIKGANDVRLYILNNQLLGAVKRENDKDFRSNYSLGGKVSLYKPSKEMVDIAIKIAQLLEADYIGVDFLIKNGCFYLNEIEDPVGARMLYKVSDIDALDLFIKDIKRVLLK